MPTTKPQLEIPMWLKLVITLLTIWSVAALPLANMWITKVADEVARKTLQASSSELRELAREVARESITEGESQISLIVANEIRGHNASRHPRSVEHTQKLEVNYARLNAEVSALNAVVSRMDDKLDFLVEQRLSDRQ
jgi:hypothetical protein